MIRDKIYCEDIAASAGLDLPWDRLKNKCVLISGAGGMIGTVLVDILMSRNAAFGDNIRVIAVGRNERSAKERFADYWYLEDFIFVKHDINDILPDLGNIDFIIHAASNTHPVAYSTDSIGTITTNVVGTYNLLRYAAQNHTERFVFLSSVEVYGENRGDTEKFDEAYCGYLDCNTLRAGYPESKRTGEALCNAFFKSKELDFVIPRLCRVYGPTMLPTDSKAIAQLLKNGVARENIVLKSEGKQRYSYCYVVDAATAILTVMLRGEPGGAYNISDGGSDISLKDLAQLISDLAGTRVIFELPDKTEAAGFSKATLALLDAQKIRFLDWRPGIHIKEGLERTLNMLALSE